MDQTFERERDVAIRAVEISGRLCQAVRERLIVSGQSGSGGVASKSDQSPVTVADFGSQAVICRALAESFPNDPVIAEEDSADLRRPESSGLLDQVVASVAEVLSDLGTGLDREVVCDWIDRGGTRRYQDRFWTLDPIDGTKGFLRGEQYAVALALIERGEVVVAALACPNLPSKIQDLDGASSSGAIFYAVKGAGAWMIPTAGSPPERIRAGTSSGRTIARFCESVESGHSAHGDSAKIAESLGIDAPPVRLDSQAKYAVVARGEADVYLRMPTRKDYREAIWDHAAGALIVAEAGGIVSDIDGQPLDWTRGPRLETNRGVVVADAKWHPKVIASIKELGLNQTRQA
jgi:3'(2'), 5'-bisphosphate nucleotidase